MTVPGFDVEQLKKKALTWTIVGFLCAGVLPGVLGLVGYLKADTDPASAASLTKWSKILTIVFIILGVLLVAAYIIVIMVVATSTSGSSY